MLNRLEQKGYLERAPDPLDRRQIRIMLADKARELRERYQQVSAQMNAIFYQGFSEEEIIRFDNTLARVLENLTRHEG